MVLHNGWFVGIAGRFREASRVLRSKPWRVPVIARNHSEAHRQASWLELFFDLAFVVAVAQAAIQLEHAFADGHPGSGLLSYAVVFAAIWWAWVAFTWFANAFDTDDVPYRVLMFVMIGGSLGLAAGVPQMTQLDFRIGVLSYVIMRLAYVVQWWRVRRSGESQWHSVAGRMIAFTTTIQLGWVGFLWIPAEWKLQAFALLFAIELAIPAAAGWDARKGGHRGHIVERYGLFTIIVLGEVIAASAVAISKAIGTDVGMLPLLTLALGGLTIVCALWWIYFDFGTGIALERGRASHYLWAYLHYFVFAALAAVGAGIALSVLWLTDPAHVHLTSVGVAMLVSGAVAAFLVALGLVELVSTDRGYWRYLWTKVVAALAVIGAAAAAPRIGVPGSVLFVGGILALLVTHGVVLEHRIHRRSHS